MQKVLDLLPASINLDWWWWCVLVRSTCGRWRQVNQKWTVILKLQREFSASLGYMRSCLKGGKTERDRDRDRYRETEIPRRGRKKDRTYQQQQN